MLRSIILWENGMVMAFDTHRQQMPELQGHISEVLDKVLAATEGEAGRDVSFELGKWRQGTTPCNREAFRRTAENTPPRHWRSRMTKTECLHGFDVDTCPLEHRYPGVVYPAMGTLWRRFWARLRLKIQAARDA